MPVMRQSVSVQPEHGAVRILVAASRDLLDLSGDRCRGKEKQEGKQPNCRANLFAEVPRNLILVLVGEHVSIPTNAAGASTLGLSCINFLPAGYQKRR